MNKKYKKVGLIAGEGDLPILFLNEAQKNNINVIVFKISDGDKNQKKIIKKFKTYDIKITQLSKIIKLAKKDKLKYMLMLGYVKHTNVLKNIRFDIRTLKTLLKIKDRRAKTILNAVIDEFKKEGIYFINSTYLLNNHLADRGNMTQIPISSSMFANIKFGEKIAKKIADMDIGQTIIVKNKVVVAVEAQEGTDECIKRGGKIAGSNFVVIKMARTNQNLKYDIPVIGLNTLRLIKKFNGKGIVVSFGKTLLLNKEKTINFANNNNIFIYGI